MTSPTDPAERVADRAAAVAMKALALLGRSYSAAEHHDIQGAVEKAAAIALADEERAAAVPEVLWAEWERLRNRYADACFANGSAVVECDIRTGEQAERSASTALDAFVRRVMAAAEAPPG